MTCDARGTDGALALISNLRDGFEMKDGCPRFVGFLGVESEVEGPVVEVVGIDEGLVADGVVGVELLEETF